MQQGKGRVDAAVKAFMLWVLMLPLKTFLKTSTHLAGQHWILVALNHAVAWSCFVSYLVVVYQVENQVYVSMYRLVLSQLRFHSVQPVNESLESVCKLAGKQQGLLQLVLSAEERRLLLLVLQDQ